MLKALHRLTIAGMPSKRWTSLQAFRRQVYNELVPSDNLPDNLIRVCPSCVSWREFVSVAETSDTNIAAHLTDYLQLETPLKPDIFTFPDWEVGSVHDSRVRVFGEIVRQKLGTDKNYELQVPKRLLLLKLIEFWNFMLRSGIGPSSDLLLARLSVLHLELDALNHLIRSARSAGLILDANFLRSAVRLLSTVSRTLNETLAAPFSVAFTGLPASTVIAVGRREQKMQELAYLWETSAHKSESDRIGLIREALKLIKVGVRETPTTSGHPVELYGEFYGDMASSQFTSASFRAINTKRQTLGQVMDDLGSRVDAPLEFALENLGHVLSLDPVVLKRDLELLGDVHSASLHDVRVTAVKTLCKYLFRTLKPDQLRMCEKLSIHKTLAQITNDLHYVIQVLPGTPEQIANRVFCLKLFASPTTISVLLQENLETLRKWGIEPESVDFRILFAKNLDARVASAEQRLVDTPWWSELSGPVAPAKALALAATNRGLVVGISRFFEKLLRNFERELAFDKLQEKLLTMTVRPTPKRPRATIIDQFASRSFSADFEISFFGLWRECRAFDVVPFSKNPKEVYQRALESRQFLLERGFTMTQISGCKPILLLSADELAKSFRDPEFEARLPDLRQSSKVLHALLFCYLKNHIT